MNAIQNCNNSNRSFNLSIRQQRYSRQIQWLQTFGYLSHRQCRRSASLNANYKFHLQNTIEDINREYAHYLAQAMTKSQIFLRKSLLDINMSNKNEENRISDGTTLEKGKNKLLITVDSEISLSIDRNNEKNDKLIKKSKRDSDKHIKNRQEKVVKISEKIPQICRKKEKNETSTTISIERIPRVCKEKRGRRSRSEERSKNPHSPVLNYDTFITISPSTKSFDSKEKRECHKNDGRFERFFDYLENENSAMEITKCKDQKSKKEKTCDTNTFLIVNKGKSFDLKERDLVKCDKTLIGKPFNYKEQLKGDLTYDDRYLYGSCGTAVQIKQNSFIAQNSDYQSHLFPIEKTGVLCQETKIIEHAENPPKLLAVHKLLIDVQSEVPFPVQCNNKKRKCKKHKIHQKECIKCGYSDDSELKYSGNECRRSRRGRKEGRESRSSSVHFDIDKDKCGVIKVGGRRHSSDSIVIEISERKENHGKIDNASRLNKKKSKDKKGMYNINLDIKDYSKSEDDIRKTKKDGSKSIRKPRIDVSISKENQRSPSPSRKDLKSHHITETAPLLGAITDEELMEIIRMKIFDDLAFQSKMNVNEINKSHSKKSKTIETQKQERMTKNVKNKHDDKDISVTFQIDNEEERKRNIKGKKKPSAHRLKEVLENKSKDENETFKIDLNFITENAPGKQVKDKHMIKKDKDEILSTKMEIQTVDIYTNKNVDKSQNKEVFVNKNKDGIYQIDLNFITEDVPGKQMKNKHIIEKDKDEILSTKKEIQTVDIRNNKKVDNSQSKDDISPLKLETKIDDQKEDTAKKDSKIVLDDVKDDKSMNKNLKDNTEKPSEKIDPVWSVVKEKDPLLFSQKLFSLDSNVTLEENLLSQNVDIWLRKKESLERTEDSLNVGLSDIFSEKDFFNNLQSSKHSLKQKKSFNEERLTSVDIILDDNLEFQVDIGSLNQPDTQRKSMILPESLNSAKKSQKKEVIAQRKDSSDLHIFNKTNQEIYRTNEMLLLSNKLSQSLFEPYDKECERQKADFMNKNTKKKSILCIPYNPKPKKCVTKSKDSCPSCKQSAMFFSDNRTNSIVLEPYVDNCKNVKGYNERINYSKYGSIVCDPNTELLYKKPKPKKPDTKEAYSSYGVMEGRPNVDYYNESETSDSDGFDNYPGNVQSDMYNRNLDGYNLPSAPKKSLVKKESLKKSKPIMEDFSLKVQETLKPEIDIQKVEKYIASPPVNGNEIPLDDKKIDTFYINPLPEPTNIFVNERYQDDVDPKFIDYYDTPATRIDPQNTYGYSVQPNREQRRIVETSNMDTKRNEENRRQSQADKVVEEAKEQHVYERRTDTVDPKFVDYYNRPEINDTRLLYDYYDSLIPENNFKNEDKYVIIPKSKRCKPEKAKKIDKKKIVKSSQDMYNYGLYNPTIKYGEDVYERRPDITNQEFTDFYNQPAIDDPRVLERYQDKHKPWSDMVNIDGYSAIPKEKVSKTKILKQKRESVSPVNIPDDIINFIPDTYNLYPPKKPDDSRLYEDRQIIRERDITDYYNQQKVLDQRDLGKYDNSLEPGKDVQNIDMYSLLPIADPVAATTFDNIQTIERKENIKTKGSDDPIYGLYPPKKPSNEMIYEKRPNISDPNYTDYYNQQRIDDPLFLEKIDYNLEPVTDATNVDRYCVPKIEEPKIGPETVSLKNEVPKTYGFYPGTSHIDGQLYEKRSNLVDPNVTDYYYQQKLDDPGFIDPGHDILKPGIDFQDIDRYCIPTLPETEIKSKPVYTNVIPDTYGLYPGKMSIDGQHYERRPNVVDPVHTDYYNRQKVEDAKGFDTLHDILQPGIDFQDIDRYCIPSVKPVKKLHDTKKDKKFKSRLFYPGSKAMYGEIYERRPNSVDPRYADFYNQRELEGSWRVENYPDNLQPISDLQNIDRYCLPRESIPKKHKRSHQKGSKPQMHYKDSVEIESLDSMRFGLYSGTCSRHGNVLEGRSYVMDPQYSDYPTVTEGRDSRRFDKYGVNLESGAFLENLDRYSLPPHMREAEKVKHKKKPRKHDADFDFNMYPSTRTPDGMVHEGRSTGFYPQSTIEELPPDEIIKTTNLDLKYDDSIKEPLESVSKAVDEKSQISKQETGGISKLEKDPSVVENIRKKEPTDLPISSYDHSEEETVVEKCKTVKRRKKVKHKRKRIICESSEDYSSSSSSSCSNTEFSDKPTQTFNIRNRIQIEYQSPVDPSDCKSKKSPEELMEEKTFERVDNAVIDSLFIECIDSLLSCYHIRWKPFIPKYLRSKNCHDCIPIQDILRQLANPPCSTYTNFCCNYCQRWIPQKNRDEHVKWCKEAQRDVIIEKKNKEEVIEKKMKNRQVNSMPGTICYVCGRYFTKYSILIHENACLEKWVKWNEQLPESQRKKIPEKPLLSNHMIRENYEKEKNRGNKKFTLKDAENTLLYEASIKNHIDFEI